MRTKFLEAAEAGAEHAPVIRQVVGKKETRLAKAVIIASGAHHRKLGIPGEAELPEKVFPTARPATARSSGKDNGGGRGGDGCS